jgi:uncharacterized protein involved in type VI secretion and phage assembly
VLGLALTRSTAAQDEAFSGGRAFGLVRGIVVDVQDPDAAGRIKVKFPFLPNSPEIWARVSLPLGGNQTGLWALPDIGDEVVVGFEQGDPRRPFVIGSVWDGKRP